MIDQSVQLLHPPYRAFTSFETDVPPPTGTVALTPPITDMGTLERTLRSIAKHAPWLPVAVWTTPDARYQLDITLPSMRVLTGAHAALVVPSPGTHPLVMDVLDAIARRAPPPSEHLGGWCARRLGRPDLAEDLAFAMNPVRRLPARGDDRALRRRLSKAGLPPRLALGRLVVIAGAYRLDQAITEAGIGLGLSPQQLRTWLQRLTGCTVERWVQQPGWEWVAEEMLRWNGTRAALQPPVPVHGPSPGTPGQIHPGSVPAASA